MNLKMHISYPEKLPKDIEAPYVIILAKYKNKWVFVRHKDRDTWELPAGHIEKGEDAHEAARRELYEETGAVEYDLDLLSPYLIENDEGTKGGYLFFAKIYKLQDLPEGFEIAECIFSISLPANLTYPEIQTEFFNYMQYRLNIQSSSDEEWDIYDENRQKTGRTHKRGQPLQEGDFHIVVGVWVLDTKTNKYLITQRSENKGYALFWENTGGSALAGDDSQTAAIREVFEETGIKLLPENGKLMLSTKAKSDFNDVWLFKQAISLDDVVLQEGETIDARLASKEEILEMIEKGSFVPLHYLDDFKKLFK